MRIIRAREKHQDKEVYCEPGAEEEMTCRKQGGQAEDRQDAERNLNRLRALEGVSRFGVMQKSALIVGVQERHGALQ